jgi:hypothetical protein
MTRIDARIQSLIERINAGESIDHDRETTLAGLEFVADSFDRCKAADDELERVTG